MCLVSEIGTYMKSQNRYKSLTHFCTKKREFHSLIETEPKWEDGRSEGRNGGRRMKKRTDKRRDGRTIKRTNGRKTFPRNGKGHLESA